MDIRQVQAWVAVASLSGVLWLLYEQLSRTSPGPISMTHAQEPKLLGRANCVLCHGTEEGDMASACAECHPLVAADIRAQRGFHGTLVDVDANDCGGCHTEHLGGDFPLISEKSFALAGFEQRQAFDHSSLHFTLEGRHAELGCIDCHTNADLLVLPTGALRFQGLEQGCQNCHEDVHQGRIVRECASCHGQEHPFALVASFQHDTFVAENAHAAPACVVCHPVGSQHDAELLAGADPPDCQRTCLDCHESPHHPEFIAAAANMADVAEGASCELCHSEAHGSFAGHDEALPPELHAASGFPLDAPHNQAACVDCHLVLERDESVPFYMRYPQRAADDCFVCHGDPHDGQFEQGSFAGADCLACHQRAAFVPSAFGVAEHERTEFPLAESHQAVACSSCHTQPDPGEPRQFQGTPSACEACHEDAHQGAFVEAAATFSAEAEEGCAHCHQPTLFSEFKADAFDHGAWTGFPLEGAHERAECEACHEPSAEPDEFGRTFGVIETVFGQPAESCVACHADPHAGKFDLAELPATLEGRAGCERCHSSEDFDTLRQATFEHERWTGYPMADFHAQLKCEECHVPGSTPDEFGRTFGRSGTACADCHEDPHVGQFAREGATDCSRCHQDAGGLAFDHQRDSRYPLDEIHAKVECSACHVPWPLPDGGEAVRYKPLGTECVDCHDPAFVERNRGKVTIPHRDEGGFSPRRGGG